MVLGYGGDRDYLMATPPTAPTPVVATVISSTRIDITWGNTSYYDQVDIWRKVGAGDYAWYRTLSGSSEYMEDSDCVAETEHCYKARGIRYHPYGESDFSDEDCETTFAVLHVPTEVVATAISGIEIEVTFKDNCEAETSHLLEREISTDPGVWPDILNLDPNREFFRDGGLFLDKVAAYTDCIPTDIGKQVNDDGGEIGLLVEYDNARRRWLIDSNGHPIASGESMSITGGDGEGTAARDTTGLVSGSEYKYRVSAIGAGGPAGPVESNSETTIVVPAAPVLAAIPAADIQDKSIRIRWSDVVSETGYRIEMTDNGFAADEGDLIAVVGADITDFLATGLDVNTAYTFRVRAYNAAGNSAYSAERAATTLAAYVPTEFEKWIRNPNIEPVYLAEIYTKMDLTEFEPLGISAGVTWEKEIEASDRGIDILEVFENGTAYTEAALVGGELADPKTFWFDYDNRILYIHATGGADPADFLIEGAFWLYFSTHKDIEFTVASGRLTHYLPLLAREDIPDIAQEIKPYFEGSFSISSGSIAFVNAKIMGEHFFDKKYRDYTWENSRLILKAGRDDFVYADFERILTSLIDKKSCKDDKITFTLRDLRQEMERSLILNTFTVEEFPDVEKDFIGDSIPLCFGTKFNVVPVPIDIDRRKYKFHDGRSKSVEAVYKNYSLGGASVTPLTEDEDYFVDLQRSIITFERDVFELSEEDIIEVDFIGTVNSADEPISNGAEIFKYLMNVHYELLNSELDLDSIYETKYAKTNELSIFLYKDKPYREIVRSIEHSMEAYTFQDVEGRLGLKVQLTVAESKSKYIVNHQIFDHQQSKDRKSLFWKVDVWFNENPQSQKWEKRSAQDDDIFVRYDIKNILNIYSYFSDAYSAQNLATTILALLNKERIEDTAPMLLFDVMAGDIIEFSRDRFYSAAGTVAEGSEIPLRIIKIAKSPASGRTVITTEIV